MTKSVLNLFAAALLGTANLWAQATATGSILGTVYDSTHAVIQGASVTITSTRTGFTRSDKTGSDGTYRFTEIPADTYKVTVSAPGFTTGNYENVQVQVATTAEVNATLNAGSSTQVITVEGAAALVDVTKTDVSLPITPDQVQNLPLNGRDFANLAFLAPGAKPVNSYDPTKNRVAVFGIDGSNGRNVNVTVNGIDDKDNTVGGPVMQLPLGAVEEFNISTQRFSAANGRSEGAAINLITKSGTNQFHGSLFLFERDTSLNADDYFDVQQGLPTPPYSRQQYGGSFGGPIVKDNTFVFFALERQREQTTDVVSQQAFNELTLAKPLGAQPSQTIPTPYNDQRYTGRLDHRFGANETLFVTYNSQSNTSLNDQSGSLNDLTAGNFTTNQLILANVNLTSVLSPSMVNSFTAGYQYWNNLIDSHTKVPYVTFGTTGIYFGTNPNVPQQSYQAKWQFRDDFSITKGRHEFKFGADFVAAPKLGGFFQTPSTLNVTFIDLPSKILGNSAQYPQGFATPGAVIAMSASSGNPYFADQGAKMFGAYFQDDWKVNTRFTLNVGLRWDKDFNLQGANTQYLDRTYLNLKAVGSPFAAGLPHNDNKDFSPRFGFAYDLTGSGRHILRGGYGIYFGQTFENIPLFTQQQENNTLFTQVLSISSTGPGDPHADIVPGTGIRLSNWRYGVDPFPAIPAASANLTAGSVGRLVDPNYHNPYNQEWNLGYSWQITPNDVFEVEGIHTLELRDSKRQNINAKNFVTGARPYDALFAAAGLPLLAQIIVESSIGRARYDALNFSYRRRLTHHFTVNTNYVLSRALAYYGSTANFSNVSPDPNNLFNPLWYGPTPQDERHRWVFSGYLELPWHLQVAPIVQWASGRPYNATEGLDVFGYGSGNGSWPAIVPTASPANYTATANYTAAQLRAGLANGSLETLPYDYFRGARFFQADLRVSKTFVFAERHRLELICQMFNLTNHANFGNTYQTSIRASNFGLPIGYLSPSGVIIPHAFTAEMGFQYSF